MARPEYFRDEMIRGAFKSYSHEHFFKMMGPTQTEKRDVMLIEAPLGPIGKIAETLFLSTYMRTFLRKKNAELKRLIEAPGGN
jgi:hypothetical protein